jgi:hypothetical protein
VLEEVSLAGGKARERGGREGEGDKEREGGRILLQCHAIAMMK